MLVFSNAGEIDIRAITTLGVNVKGSEAALGQFGTGLKYAIAGTLRLGGKVVIWTGNRRLEFGTTRQDIRGKEFGIVTMMRSGEAQAPEQLGFTTALGKHWEPWMIYREFLVNSLDEGGTVEMQIGEWRDFGVAGYTSVLVTCEELDRVHAEAGDYFLASDLVPLARTKNLRVFEKQGDLQFCVNGVKVASGWSKFTYDWIGKAPALTEDRTLKDEYSMRRDIAREVMKLEDESAIRDIITQEGPVLDLNWDGEPVEVSEEFKRAAVKATKEKKVTCLGMSQLLRKVLGQAKWTQLFAGVPDEWGEMVKQAPQVRENVEENISALWSAYWDLADGAKKAEAAAKYWEKCARKLAKQRDESDEAL